MLESGGNAAKGDGELEELEKTLTSSFQILVTSLLSECLGRVSKSLHCASGMERGTKLEYKAMLMCMSDASSGGCEAEGMQPYPCAGVRGSRSEGAWQGPAASQQLSLAC